MRKSFSTRRESNPHPRVYYALDAQPLANKAQKHPLQAKKYEESFLLHSNVMSFSRKAKDLNAVLQVVLLNGEGPSGDFDDGAVVEVVGEEGRVDRGRH